MLCQVAAKAPNGVLRTHNTINKFKLAPTQPGSPPLFLVYFNQILLDSSLNAMETIELAKHVIQQGKQVLSLYLCTISAMDLKYAQICSQLLVLHTITLCAVHYIVKYADLPGYLCVF